MNKFSFMCFGIFLSVIFASTAVASESLYKSHNKIIYIGYTSLADVTTIDGLKVGWEGMTTDNLSIGLEGNFLNETAMLATVVTMKMTTINGFIGYHTSFTDMLGGYVKLGYGTSTASISGLRVSGNGTGLVCDIGGEYKFSQSLIGHIGYKSYSMDYSTGTTSTTITNTGITCGIGLLF